MNESALYVLDTHVLIWYFIGSKRLSEKLKDVIDERRRKGGRILVPTIVLAEALDVAEKQKVDFDFNLIQCIGSLKRNQGLKLLGLGLRFLREPLAWKK